MQAGSGKQTQTHGCEPPYLGARVGADQDMQFQLYSRNEEKANSERYVV